VQRDSSETRAVLLQLQLFSPRPAVEGVVDVAGFLANQKDSFFLFLALGHVGPLPEGECDTFLSDPVAAGRYTATGTPKYRKQSAPSARSNQSIPAVSPREGGFSASVASVRHRIVLTRKSLDSLDQLDALAMLAFERWVAPIVGHFRKVGGTD
jgi:hypothetical protein